MMPTLVAFTIGLFVGAGLGVLVTGLVFAAARADMQTRDRESEW